jgi:O-phosphoseryl-tRNA synthetase
MVKKVPKKTKQTESIQDDKKSSESMEEHKVKKKKKVPISKVDSKKNLNENSKGKVKPEEKPVLAEKNNKKKLEPKAKVPIDARVIDVGFDEEVPKPESTEPQVEEKRDERINYLTGKGTQHPVHEMIQGLRTILINSGFNELENSFFVSEKDIFKQHDVTPNLMFDNIYYLAESQRPIVSLTQDQINDLQNIVPELNLLKFNEILSEYQENKIENYEIFKRLQLDLDLTSEQITKMLKVIPQLNESNPKLTNVTLRSTMGSAWFTTLAAIVDKENLPIKVFSTGIWFKRGPKLNELKLTSHYGASCIIMDEKITVENGKVIAGAILNRLGFKELEFKTNDQSKNFNVTENEFSILLGKIEIATCGVYSKPVLNKYGIEIPTLYINFGLEHMVMVQKGIDDIRELMYPQFYKAWKLNDQEIAEALQFIIKPKTEIGKEIANNIVKICEKNGNTPAPCEFKVWEGAVSTTNNCIPEESTKPMGNNKKTLSVTIFKHDKDSKLCGPAYMNEVVVRDGDVFSLPVSGFVDDKNNLDTIHTNIRYLDAFSKMIGRKIERRILKNKLKDKLEFKVGIVKDMEDVNLQLDGGALRYVLTNNKKIDIRGPMFVNIECKLKSSVEDKNNKV